MPQDSFTPALARLDPASRALLDLSLRRDMRPEEIGDLLGTDPESVIVAREAALEQLAAELGLDEGRDLDDLRVRLSDLPSEAWTQEPKAEPVAEPASEPEAGPETSSEPDPELKAEGEPEPAEEPEPPRPGLRVVGPASAAATAADAKPAPKKERRSRLPLLLTLLALAAVVLVVVLASSGGDDESTSSNAPAPAPQSPEKPGKPAKPSKDPAPESKDIALTPVAGASGIEGSARLLDGGKRLSLEVDGLPPGSYEVWLYDSVIDAVSIGKGTGPKLSLDVKLPSTATNYRYIDVSREPDDGNANHSGESVLRVPLVKLAP